ncbi:proline-rich protein 7 [Centropristis striata]|uniref:proline-rich protein 7 n=1 Tax=Centropristis striata TaxID=184440 RepID=UPI0027DEFF77|nr:proline-rich protein 7 [Centropristis striata]XP_059208127.1 proline-rich protein 7 [Centropristis striata]
MVMSQGTYTFLACFAGFWLVWALIVMLCCFCSFLQRRLKRRHEERLREQCLRTVEMEPLSCQPAGYPAAPPPPAPPPPPPPLQLPREPPQFCPPRTMSPPLPLPVPHPMPEANWISMPDTDIFGKPPCYEEAVLMEDPPPPYSEVLADPRGGTYLKPSTLRVAPPRPPPLRELPDPAPVFTSETSKPPVMAVFPERGYSSLIRLPSSQRWDSLGHLLSNMDLNHNNLTPPGARSIQAAAAMATMPRREPRTHHDELGLRGGIQGLQGSIQGFQGSIQGLRGGIQGLQGSRRGLQRSIQGLPRGIQGLEGGIQGLQGGIQGFQGGLQGLQGVHGLRGLEPSCGLPTAFPLLGRSTAV